MSDGAEHLGSTAIVDGRCAGRLPRQFMQRMTELLGADEATSLFMSLALPSSVGLRLNTLRGGVAELAAAMPWSMQKVPWCPAGYVVTRGDHDANRADGTPAPSAGHHPFQLAGAYYLQDPAAMAVAEAMAPRPGETVLDLAAAPGGKSTHLAALLGGQGWLVANDVHLQRAQALAGNLERCGVANATVTSETPARLAALWPGLFDRVLLDAPCSGEGMFRKSDDALSMWSVENIGLCAARQDSLLQEAARLVKPGGYLAYSTCTLAPEENEGSVARFVRSSGFEVVPLALPGTSAGRPDWSGAAPVPALAGTVRLWPHLVPGEGHFVALLRRPTGSEPTGSSERVRNRSRKRDSRGARAAVPRQALDAWQEFASEAIATPWATKLAPNMVQGEWLVRAPDITVPLEGLKWLRHGVQLGRLRVGRRSARLEPAHALAMALKPAAVANRLSLAANHGNLARFMRGEEFEAPGAPGYVRVEVEGLPLGWGKRSGEVVRSLVPKGLRRTLQAPVI